MFYWYLGLLLLLLLLLLLMLLLLLLPLLLLLLQAGYVVAWMIMWSGQAYVAWLIHPHGPSIHTLSLPPSPPPSQYPIIT